MTIANQNFDAEAPRYLNNAGDTIAGVTYTLVTPNAGAVSGLFSSPLFVSITPDDNDQAVVFNYDGALVIPGLFDARIASSDGSGFKMVSMEIDTGTSVGTTPLITITGYRSGVAVAGAVDTINTGVSDSTGSIIYVKNGAELGFGGVISFDHSWYNVDEIRFTGVDTIIAIDDLVFAAAVPVVTDGNISVSGASGVSGTYRIGDTVTVTWNNTAIGDNNSDVSGVTVDFSQFGGGTAVAALNLSGTWTATYTISAGSVDAANRNVSVTATNSADVSSTSADTTNATVDNVAPSVTDGRISISGGTGTGGAYKVGDTVVATWNNTAGGDNNADTISGVTVDFSQFGGGAAVAATNSSGIWTATYTITAGSVDAMNRNAAVTVTDNAGNATTVADTANATVDNITPVLTDGNISISGASGVGGRFIAGDTVVATWNNTAGGDNNTDTLSGVTVDFSQFGGGTAVVATNSAGTWTATYTLAGSIDATGLNVAVTVVDNAGNASTASDTTGAIVDTTAPAVASVNAPSAGTYVKDDTLTFVVNLDESVTFSGVGSPRLAIDLDTGGRVYANYVSGTSALSFALVIAPGQVDSNGITIAELQANGAIITDISGNAANLTLNSVDDTSGILVDAPASVPGGGGGSDGGSGGDIGKGDATTPMAGNVIVATPSPNGEPVTIAGGAGIDEVQINGSVVLGDGMENALLIGLGDFTVAGNDLDNIIYGNAGDTTIHASAGRDFIDGGFGNNTVVFGGPASDFSVRIVGGIAHVTHLASGDVTSIANVSTLQFADASQSLFATGQFLVAGFYEVFLGRALDQAGFEYWMNESFGGQGPSQMLQHFVNSPEFLARIADLSPEELVESLYANFLQRAGDTAGQAYWAEAVEGGMSYGDIAANFVLAQEVGMRIDELFSRNDWLNIA
jgi:hypothetical protein